MTELFLMKLTPYLTPSVNETEGGERRTGFDLLRSRAAAAGIGVERWDVQRIARCERKQHTDDKIRMLAAGILLQYGLRDRGIETRQITYTEQGRPLLVQGGLQISLSHSGRYAVCALAEPEQPVGVDVERVRRTTPRLRKSRLLTEAERALLEQTADTDAALADEQFCRIWTRLESRFKCFGTTAADGREAIYWERRIAGSEPYCICVCERDICKGTPLRAYQVTLRGTGAETESVGRCLLDSGALLPCEYGKAAYEYPVLNV